MGATALAWAQRRERNAYSPDMVRGQAAHPRPTNGILLAMTVRNSTFASSGRLAM